MTDETGATATATKTIPVRADGNDTNGPPPVIGGSSPTDPDGDAVYEDVNGDSSVDVNDVTALWANRNGDAIQNNPAAFDANGDGPFNVNDVTALWSELRG